MAALWMLAGLFVATFAAAGALILGASIISAVLVYILSGATTLCLGLVAALLDDAAKDQASDPHPIIPGEQA